MADRRRAFAEWVNPTMPSCCHRSRAGHPGRRGRRNSLPIPGYLTRPANHLGLCSLAMPRASPATGGSAAHVQIVCKLPSPEHMCRQRFRDARYRGFHRRAPDLLALGLYGDSNCGFRTRTADSATPFIQDRSATTGPLPLTENGMDPRTRLGGWRCGVSRPGQCNEAQEHDEPNRTN